MKVKKLFKNDEEIRKRKSFDMWNNWLKMLKGCPRKAILLRSIWSEIDNRNGFMSRYNSHCSSESLELLISDRRL